MTSPSEISVTDLLSSVLWTLESEIGPRVVGPYAESLCKTSAALLRSCLVRIDQEGAFLCADIRRIRSILAAIAASFAGTSAADIAQAAVSAPAVDPPESWPTLSELAHEAERLRTALAAAVDTVPTCAAPELTTLQESVRRYLDDYLAGQAPWMVNPFAGEVR